MLFSVLVLAFLSVLQLALAAPAGEHRNIVRQQAYNQDGFMVVNNNLGQARGVPLNNGAVYRFTVKYATTARFANPVKLTQWLMPNNDPTALPPRCPQTANIFPNQPGTSEDCLYLVLYVPRTVLNTINTAPVYVWFHGGSFTFGSASDPGLDGSKLAMQMNGIVIMAQYRLGVLGFLPPPSAGSGAKNLGVKDAITALDFINGFISFFGGNNQVTIGGQSSGGHMVRAPSAAGFFRAATLHGDPMNYGFEKTSVHQALQTAFYTGLCNGGDLQCMRSTPLSTILSAQDNFVNTGQAFFVDPSVGTGEPLRPIVDGTTIQFSLTTTYPSQKKPLFITNNKNEAGQAIGNSYPFGCAGCDFVSSMVFALGQNRTDTILAAPWYNPSPPADRTIAPAYRQNGDVIRQALERIGTDQQWRCANWDFARRWAGVGGTAYVGVFDLGALYTDNVSNNYCTQDGVVCHEDEKFLLFGTAPNPTSAQSTLSAQIQARLVKFINNPNQAPNPPSYAQWNAATSSDAKAIALGGSTNGQAVPILGCDPSFWGASVPFDWQVFGE